MDIIVNILIALISSGTVGAIVTALIKRITKENPSNIALRLLLQDKLTYLIKKSLEEDNHRISYSNYHMIQQMYQSYKALGGNGDMKHLMDAIDKLDVFIDSKDI